MRLVIDMQGAQAGNHFSQTGRHFMALVQAMAIHKGSCEVLLAINGALGASVDDIRLRLAGVLPSDAFRIWTPPAPFDSTSTADEGRRLAAELIHEGFVQSLEPDAILVGSVLAMAEKDAAISIGKLPSIAPVAALLHDLTSLKNPAASSQTSDALRWKQRKLADLRRADLLLTTSSTCTRDAIDHFHFLPEQVTEIGLACHPRFRADEGLKEQLGSTRRRLGIRRPFLMHVGDLASGQRTERLLAAYALLPSDVRSAHQFVMAFAGTCANPEYWQRIASSAGLIDGELVVAASLSEDELVAMYNACHLFVAHGCSEGLGLSAVEAMACGRPTVGDGTSGLFNDIIEPAGARFDPDDPADMARVVRRALHDDAFRRELTIHAQARNALPDVDHTARQTWLSLKSLTQSRDSKPASPVRKSGSPRLRLAYVSPLPGARSGIADYSAELLPELARLYDIDVVVQQDEPVEDCWIQANTPTRSVAWFRAHHDQFDRVLYHFGNSRFHSHMFELLDAIPGVVVLHDVFLSNIILERQWTGEDAGGWSRALLHCHGWSAVIDSASSADPSHARWTYPCSLDVIQKSLGLIVHSGHAKRLVERWYGSTAPDVCAVLPLVRSPLAVANHEQRKRLRTRARRALGIPETDTVVCSFGHLGESKLNHRLLKAWQLSSLPGRGDCQLVFVGHSEPHPYTQALEAAIADPASGRVRVTGFTDPVTYRQWLLAADVAVQLRTQSRGETSAAVLDCWNHGLATVVNANGSLAELPDDAVLKLADDFSDEALVNALNRLREDADLRQVLGNRARQRLLAHHHPQHGARSYANAIEQAYDRASRTTGGVLHELQRIKPMLSEADTTAIATAIAKTFPPQPRRAQWLLDCSVLVQTDLKTGIERVVRALLRELLSHPPPGVNVEAVYSSPEFPGYRYARQFTCRLLDLPADWARDDAADVWAGDTFIALDFVQARLPEQSALLSEWRTRGVRVWAVVYDLLPLLLPDYFPASSAPMHQRWLKTVASLDGAVAISRSVADELFDWLEAHGDKGRHWPFDIHHVHLGADMETSMPTQGIPADGAALLSLLKSHPTFLMVGTVEPRKGHALVLSAFEVLWQSGSNAHLVIVGKQGWMVDELASRLRQHPRAGQHVHWLTGISDEYLTALYQSGTALIAASEGEGFGLPLIEAARYGIPILARDIPVFREVAGAHASYFDTNADASQLASFIARWQSDLRVGAQVTSAHLPWLTWAECAESVKQIVSGEADPYRQWQPSPPQAYWGNDLRLPTQVGRRRGRAVETTGQAGLLLSGPCIPLEAGTYQLAVMGASAQRENHASIDITCDRGRQTIVSSTLHVDAGTWTSIHEFQLDLPVADVEFRVSVTRSCCFTIHRLELVRTSYESDFHITPSSTTTA